MEIKSLSYRKLSSSYIHAYTEAERQAASQPYMHT